jgi:hypothetical protein
MSLQWAKPGSGGSKALPWLADQVPHRQGGSNHAAISLSVMR